MNRLSQQSVYILIAPEFDEASTVYCTSKLREEGLSVNLTGLTTGLVSGYRGIQLRPDSYMSQMTESDMLHSQLLILAGGDACASVLLADPRVYEWVQAIFGKGGLVVSMSPVAKKILVNTRFLRNDYHSHLVVQQHTNIALFVDELMQRISF